jgi:hypothetical protein
MSFKKIFLSDKVCFEREGHWWIKTLKKGGFRLHLEGASFYGWGIDFALREGMYPSGGGLPEEMIPFTDPFTSEMVYITYKLVLKIRSLPSGEIVFHSLLPPHEIMKLGDIYHRVQQP